MSKTSEPIKRRNQKFLLGTAAITAAFTLIPPGVGAFGFLKNPSFTLSCIAGFWSGVISSISFLEAWIKFRAQTLTLPVGVDVGRTVFWAKDRLELVLAGIVCSIGLNRAPSPKAAVLFGIPILGLLSEVLYFQPYLDDRAIHVITNGKPPEKGRIMHTLYGVIEAVKLLCLIGAIYVLAPKKSD